MQYVSYLYIPFKSPSYDEFDELGPGPVGLVVAEI